MSRSIPLTLAARSLIKHTSSLCPVCRRQLAAEVYESAGKVYLHKSCPEHGTFDVLINSDRRFYYASVGAGGNAGACCGGACAPPPLPLGEGRGEGVSDVNGSRLAQQNPSTPDAPSPGSLRSPPSPGRDEYVAGRGFGHDPALIERASTCIALIEIVESCNLQCPTCYADSPFAPPQETRALSLDEFWARLNAVLARKKTIDILQLSGGEPTIHPRFFELLEAVLRDRRIGYTLLNTNGVLLARDHDFMARLGALHAQHRARPAEVRGFEVYLQYDGPQAAGQVTLRGADLRPLREDAVAACAQHRIPVTLAMTVTGENYTSLGDAVRWGLERDAVRGITFQPVFRSGRVEPPRDPGATAVSAVSGFDQHSMHGQDGRGTREPPAHLNVADIITGLIDQSAGLLSERDFTPLPCGDPNCHTIGYLLRRGPKVEKSEEGLRGEGRGPREDSAREVCPRPSALNPQPSILPVSQLIDFSQLQGFLKDRINFNLDDLARCGCESEPLGQLLKELEIGPDHVFRLFIKPFMDVWTYDQHRIDRCCVHVIGEGGKLESFCRHYAMR